MQTTFRTPWMAALLIAAWTFAATAGASGPDDVPLLMTSPPCVKQRLGQVSVSLGNKEPNTRSGMAPSGVSYAKAFARLTEAARAKGGDAVVLRDHRADYQTQGARPARRPTYVSLQGAVVTLDRSATNCTLATIDPAQFEREALDRQGTKVVNDTGMSF